MRIPLNPSVKKYLKPILAIGIIGLTVVAFIYYSSKHPDILDRVRHIPLGTLAILLGLYGLAFLAYALVTRGSLRIYKKTMSKQENILFNAYSSLINFFGPGQSGPAFRGVYLKKRHNLSLKQYILTTLLYFGFYAAISAMMMFVGTRPWWQTMLLIVAVSVVSFLVIRRYKKRAHVGEEAHLNLKNVAWIFGATAAQLTIQFVIYAVELHNVGSTASFGQILAYTGVANFALFVALTPGAIGIRESFLLFSQNLHHIDSQMIVAANVIDRAVYLIFLGLLFILVISLHAKDKLHISKEKP